MTIQYTQADIDAQECHISHVRMMELVAERDGTPEQITAARARYDSAVRGLHMMLDSYNAQVERTTRPRR